MGSETVFWLKEGLLLVGLLLSCMIIAGFWLSISGAVDRFIVPLTWREREKIAGIGYWMTAAFVGACFLKGIPVPAALIAPPPPSPVQAVLPVPSLPAPVTLKDSHFVPAGRDGQ